MLRKYAAVFYRVLNLTRNVTFLDTGANATGGGAYGLITVEESYLDHYLDYHEIRYELIQQVFVQACLSV